MNKSKEKEIICIKQNKTLSPYIQDSNNLIRPLNTEITDSTTHSY